MKLMKKIIMLLILFSINCFIFAQTKDDAYSLYSKGNEYFNNYDYDNALTYYLKAIPVYEKVYGKTHIYTADVYFFTGLSYYWKIDYEKSLNWLNKSLEIYKSPNGDKQSEANALVFIGNIYYDYSDYNSAIDFYNISLSINKELFGEKYKETANCYSNIGMVYGAKGDHVSAIKYYNNALKIFKELNKEENLQTASCYFSIGVENYYSGNYEEAFNNYTKALEIRKKISGEYDYDVVNTIINIASVYSECQIFDDALDLFEQAEKILNGLNANYYSSYYAILYNQKGSLYYNKSDFVKAFDYWQKALEINIKLYGDSENTGVAYSNIGQVYQAMGDYSRAIANLETAITIFRKLFGNNHPRIATTSKALGRVYISIGDYDYALKMYSQAIEIYKNFYGENHIDVARCYLGMGDICQNKKDYLLALDYFRKSNNVLFEIFGYETTDIAECYDRIATIYDIYQDHENSEALYEAALNIYKTLTGEKSVQTSTEYHQLGWHYAGIKDVNKAIECFRNCYKGYNVSTNYNQIISSVCGILHDAHLYELDKNTEFIRETIALAINTIERARLDMSSIKSQLLRDSLYIYYYGVDFETKNNNSSKALEYSEMLRSRGFLDQIGLERAINLDGIDESERNEFKKIISQIELSRNEIEKQNNLPINERDSIKLIEADKSLSSSEKILAKIDEKISKKIPTYAQLRNPQPAKVKDIQKWCGNNRAILEYVLYEPDEKHTDSFAYCIIVTNKKITVISLDSDFNYDSTINNLREAITHRPMKSEVTFEKQRNDLYDKLVNPVLPYLKGTKEVLIVTDGNLSFLPFDILRENSDSPDFGKKFSIGISPSISVSMIADSIKSSTNETLLFGGAWYDKLLSEEEHNKTLRGNSNRGFDRSFANVESQTKLSVEDLKEILKNEGSTKYYELKKLNWRDLPGTITEIETLQKNTFTKARVETQKTASEANIKSMSKEGMLSNYSILHFACHGYYDPDLSEMSSVLFSEVSGKIPDSTDDGYLTIGEASSLNLNAQMVCLSACQTGLGEVKKGEGMVGLSRAFMVAGAKNVGVTLWSVDDAATAEFMTRMYKKVKSGMSYAEAYRKVKNEFRNSDEYNHPYYWAAFVVYE